MKLFRLALGLFFFPAAIVFAQFSDVDSSHPYFEAINSLQTQGVVQGYEDGAFRSENVITRSEFLKIVMESKGMLLDPSRSDLSEIFSDIETGDNSWDVPYIRTAVGQGIIQGYPDGTFRRAMPITYAEAAKIMEGVFDLGFAGDSCSIRAQMDENSAWYFQSVCRMNCVVTSDQANWRDPAHQITRGEMAFMAHMVHTNASCAISQYPTHPHLPEEQNSSLPAYSQDILAVNSSDIVVSNEGNFSVPDFYTDKWKVSLYSIDQGGIETKMLEDICVVLESRLLIACSVKGTFSDPDSFSDYPEVEGVDVFGIYLSVAAREDSDSLDGASYVLNLLDDKLPAREENEISLAFTRANVSEMFGMGLTSYQDYATNIGVVYMDNVLSGEERVWAMNMYNDIKDTELGSIVHTPEDSEMTLQALQSLSVATQLIVQTREEPAHCITGFAHPSSKLGGEFCGAVASKLDRFHQSILSDNSIAFSENEKSEIRRLWDIFGW